jgi:uncharacterized damage-inducible protein DinB
MREQLVDGFRYDLWANLRWLPTLEKFADPEQAGDIMRHILRAQHIWLTRTISEEEVGPLPEDLDAGLNQVHEAWVELLRISDPGAFVSYTTLKGESCFSTVEQIARHVVNHGTYHRGQLRGLCQAEGLEGFEETDLMGWYRLQATP